MARRQEPFLPGRPPFKLKMLGLPLPAALGIFSTTGDFSTMGDSQAIYTVTGVAGRLSPPRRDRPFILDYLGSTNPRDPVLSPLYADLNGMSPTLFLSSTRDMMLSATTVPASRLLTGRVDAQLAIFSRFILKHLEVANP
jgi:epsilon-lactone hydrolase